MFSRIFIYRPIFASVISIVIMLIGGIAMFALPIARYPEIAPPTIQVTATYPGANAETIAETVATPIEREVNGVEGMAYMTSTSSADGQMTLMITFDVGTNLDMANVLVQNRVSIAEPRLPREVAQQGIKVKKRSNETTLFISLTSPDQRFSEVYLSNYASLYLRDELGRVPGVGDVTIFGAGDLSMRVWLDPERLKSRGLTTNDVVNAIREQNVQVAAGQIGQPPAPEGQAFQYTVNTLGRLSSVEQFENIIVRTGERGQLTRIRDIAKVELGAQTYDLVSRLNGQPAAAIAIYQLPGANAISVSEGVRAKMEQMAQAFPQGLKHEIVYDSTNVINASIKEVVVTLFITLALVVFTVYVFLQNFRATLIPSLTIPVSLIGTFAVMAALGYSINQLTLFGLVLVIGIVVDDAIVVVENVTRHLNESNLNPKQATEKAMSEVTGPVIATTLVLLAVFVPTIFMGGIIGQLFQQFAVTISVATVFSSVNALTLSPALCGVLLRKSERKEFILFRWFNKSLDATTNVYAAGVRLVLRLAVIALLLFGGMIGVGVYGFAMLPTGFVPQEDEGWSVVNIQLPDGASLERTIEVMDRANDIISEIPGVANILNIGGYSLLEGTNKSNSASLIVIFDLWEERTEPSLLQDAIIMQMNMRLSQIQEAGCIAFATPSLPGVGMSGGFSMQLQDRAGGGLKQLENMANEFVFDGNAQAGLMNMYSGFRSNVTQLYVEIDREQVRKMHVPLQDVFDTLQANLGSVYVNDFTQFGRVYQVKAQAKAVERASPEDIKKLEVRNRDGRMIPLGTVVDVTEILGPQIVTHHNIYSSAKINGQGAPGFTSGQAMAILKDMASEKLPLSMGYEWTDLSYQEAKASGQASVIFLFSVILVYLVLAAQYESWSLPISICTAVPTALLGAVAALMIRQIDNNVYTQIGVVLLIGLSAKTSILIVEFAKVQRDEGDSIFDAALSAARLRFRAVLMTAFSFILGVIPLLVASGAGAASRQALGTTVFGGMLLATIISVLAVPMLYFVVQVSSEKIMRTQPAATKDKSVEVAGESTGGEDQGKEENQQ